LRADFAAPAGVERGRGYGRKMPRPPREVDPQGVYHLTTRGNNRRAVYLDDADRESFFALLTKIVDRHGWLCVAYCLMTNHYHLLVWLQNGELSEGMKTLNAGHARQFNKRYGCEGHVFRNRFHAEPVVRDSHLLSAARYIVLNPVRAGLCTRPEQWRWSSYSATAGFEPPAPFLSTAPLLEVFNSRPAVARRLYRIFVDDALQAVSDTAPRAVSDTAPRAVSDTVTGM
jgi:putative transposase